jgi:beta-glucosidase-like glycosyl hydrolase
MKHFTAYSVEDGRNTKSDTWDISLKDLSEYYFAPLKACIKKADVGALMCSYNAINKTAACADKWMNVEVVRDHWGWDGVIESDCGAISGIQDHGNAKTQAGAAQAAVEATCDMECDSAYKNHLSKLEGDGRVSRAQLEAAVGRVFKGQFQLGRFDPHSPLPGYDELHSDQVYSAAHQRLSLEGAQQSIVLLRNPPASPARLPLRRGMKIAVIGPNGDVADVYQGYSRTSPDPAHAACAQQEIDTLHPAAGNTTARHAPTRRAIITTTHACPRPSRRCATRTRAAPPPSWPAAPRIRTANRRGRRAARRSWTRTRSARTPRPPTWSCSSSASTSR